MKIFSILALFLGAISNIAIAITPKDTTNNIQPKSNIVDPVSKLGSAQNCSVNQGYLISLSVGYDDNTNWATYTIKNEKGAKAWYWGAYQVDTPIGKATLATAIYAASSGQKVVIQCDSNNYIKSLWVGPDAY
ncbi:hypothetical protein [Xenorhabdus griffiniae]|uniref:Uncharacterized protein n=1 Tax=Xenorhabdus griffiniae TaxID=351672 RepID=A0ABY9XD66_9GAMM|nr:hypothetical protein [Xenorhabdus griffiniae]MBD1227838.1 hypothetical protein [Xenorhabdus griffiniae]MBE8588623.1 hypothetical protein [Xenorhabdus griffiniae]WMV70811.1 hypothetical protein QL128_11260 [Xenorhabdus griffiniae]WNH00487.1 hypothetical protein QL112_011265 [Xenorhabdus griffiniae]